MRPLGPVRVMTAPVDISADMSRENVAFTCASRSTAVAASAGVVAVTVGGGGGVAAVVKLKTIGLARGTPATAVTVESTRTVYVVESASGAIGISIATRCVSS